MDNSIYEVERDDYAGFIGQLNTKMMDVEQCFHENCYFTKIRSKATNKVLCTRVHDTETDEEKYYVFEMPLESERIAPKQIRKITLETREEVQAFFDILNKINKEKKDGGNLSEHQ